MSATVAQPVAMQAAAGSTHIKPGRILSIDILRGLTVAFMILVNDPGDGRHVYTQLEHAAWNGWTLTDMVFPTFLFLVGCSIVFSMQSRIARGDDKVKLALNVFRRAALIYLINMTLALVPDFRWTHLRIYGVLPRIAVCYFFAAMIFLATRRIRVLMGITAVLLTIYWALMRYANVPGLGHPYVDFPFLDPDKNLAAWLDRGAMAFTQATIHAGTLYEKTRDPEGILSTIPAIGTCLLGICTGLWMRRTNPAQPGGMNLVKNRLYLLGAGVVSIVLSEIWNPWFPINKKLWTSSYVLFAAGFAAILLSLFSLEVDRETWQRRHPVLKALTWPCIVLGTNAIAAYCMPSIYGKLFRYTHFVNPNNPSRTINIWGWLYYHGLARNGSTELTSALWAFCYVCLCFIPVWILWRKKIFLKV